MKKEEFTFRSADGVTDIHCIKWAPDGEIKMILQIVHGMVEYVDRYDEFAKYCNDKGILVVGNDHLGHGKSVTSDEKLGYFADKKGNECVIADIHKLHEITHKEYPDVPYFILGHSMGSFLTRQYIMLHPEGLAGAVIMGTGYQPVPVVRAGMALCSTIAAGKGWLYRSSFIDGMAMGSYNKSFGKPDGGEWLNSKPENVSEYKTDPYCSFMFTLNGYYNMFKGLAFIGRKSNINSIPKDLPLFIVSGDEDPVGDFGKGVEKVYKELKDAGIKNVSMKLYHGSRHEILKDIEKETVFEDIVKWMADNAG